MGGQDVSDGAEWALSLFMPSAASVVLITLIEAQFGAIWAGFASLILTIVVFGGILTSLTYWHIPSTAGFLLAGFFLWRTVPDVTADIVPWPFRLLQAIIIVLFFAIASKLFLNKIGIDI